jgi:hypothetical protein
MTRRQALHELIDSLDEEHVEDLLERVEAELVEVPAMTPEAMASAVGSLKRRRGREFPTTRPSAWSVFSPRPGT